MVHFLKLNTSYAIWLTIMNDLLCHPALFLLPSLLQPAIMYYCLQVHL